MLKRKAATGEGVMSPRHRAHCSILQEVALYGDRTLNQPEPDQQQQQSIISDDSS